MADSKNNSPSINSPTTPPYLREVLASMQFPPGCDTSGWRIGAYTYGVPQIRWWGEPANLIIGKFCSIADNVRLFLGGNHRTDWVTTYPFSVITQWPEAHAIEGHPATNGDIVIGNDVWLGSGCSLLSGVTIGDGAVIGLNSVVAGDVEPYSIVAGNKTVEIRKRFEPEEIAMLQEMRWWDWEEAEIRASVGLLCSSDISRLYEHWRWRQNLAVA